MFSTFVYRWIHIGVRALHVLNLIWFGCISRLSQWGRGGSFPPSNDFYTCLPSRRGRGGGGRHPVILADLRLVVMDGIGEAGEEGEAAVLVQLEAGGTLAQLLPPALSQEKAPCSTDIPLVRIRIRRIHMFLGLPAPAPDPSIIKQK